LNERSGALARVIVERIGVEPCAVVTLLDQGVPAIISILAVLKAGKWFVPLDPEATPDLLRAQIEHAEARLILTDALTGSNRWSSSTPVLNVEDARGDGPIKALPDRSLVGDVACVFYTSGSTGAPKGVVDIHRNVVHNVSRYTEQLQIGPEDRLSLIQPCNFSGTLSSLFGALLNGAAVCPYSLRRRGIAGLTSWLCANRVTIFHSVPSIFRGMLRPDSWLPDVRVVRLEGDRALAGDLTLFKKHCPPRSVLAVGLGATETGLSRQWRAHHGTFWPSGGLPLGYAVRDVEVSIRDEHGRELPAGQEGEIWVYSSYLASGYWRDEQRTRMAFSDDPADEGRRIYRSGDLGCLRRDGCLEFRGRKGQQHKVRGVWVNLAEVEEALTALPGVAEAVVVAHAGAHEPKLAAFVVPCPGAVLEERDLRASLRRRVPGCAMPASIDVVDRLPRSRHHKIDRGALQERPRPPQNFLADKLLAIWRDAFGVVQLGYDDDFFQMGGDSAVAALICSMIADELGLDIPESVLRDYPSVTRLAEYMRDMAPVPGRGRLVALKATGTRPPLLLVPSHIDIPALFADLAYALPDDQPVYAGRLPRAGSIGEMARQLVSDLRARQPSGPYFLAGYCYGGTVVWEMASQLLDAGERIGLLALMMVAPRELPGLFSAYHRRFIELDERMWRAKRAMKRLLSLGGRKCFRLARDIWRRRRADRRSPEFQRLRRLQAEYRTRPLSCPVELFLPYPVLNSIRGAERGAWSRVSTSAVHIHRLAADDRRILERPFVEDTAALFRRLIGIDQPGAQP
jgi:amino acid adenylation domain-containing protein